MERNTRSVTARTNSTSPGRFGLAFLSGLLLVASFPPLDLGLLAWVALVPLLFAIRGLPPRQAFGVGYAAGFVAFAGVVAWIRVFGLPVWVLLAAYLALYVGAFCSLYAWAGADRSTGVRLWLVPILWVTLEYVRSIGPMGFPWATLGSSQHGLLPVIQIAAATGVVGISGLVALGNAVAAALGSRRVLTLLGPAVVIVAVLGWGSQHARPHPPGPLIAVALQPNVPQREKFAAEMATRNMNRLEDLVRTAQQAHPALIVFPETALPINLFGAGGALGRVGQWAREAQATVLASSLEDGFSNIAVTVAPSGQPLSRYDKVRLVAFGEAGVRPGTRHDPLTTPWGPVGVAICFESIFPDVTRALVHNGAEVLAIITNDAWFDGTSGPPQHAAHAVLRAVETDRWVIRAANTGISMIIDPTGHVTAMTSPQQQGVLVGRLAPTRTVTFYVRWGDLFAWTTIVSFVALMAPRMWGMLRAEWRVPAFHQALVVVIFPLVAAGVLLDGGREAWGWPLLLLGFVGLLSFLRPPGTWGFTRLHALQSLGAGLVVVLGLWMLLALSYRAQGIPVIWPPQSAWATLVVRQIGIAVVLESWLRGLAFASVAEWKGWSAAIVGTTLLGMALQTGLSAEALAWAMVTGFIFGLIRMRTGNMTGLIIPHAVGNLLLGLVAIVR